jgi:glycosyltransferase involved in cell wall biosynthesis
VALGRGGAVETVQDGRTGVLYPDPGPEALAGAIDRLRRLRFNEDELRRNSVRFSRGRFRENLRTALDAALRGLGQAGLADAMNERFR